MNEVKENRQRKFNKWFYIGLGIAFLAQAIVAVAIFLYEFYTFRSIVDSEGVRIITSANLTNMLSDMFVIPSVICILLYLLMYVSKEGAFDAIAYSAKLVFYSIFAKNTRDTKLPATYGDYRLMKQGKERNSSLFLLFAAIPFFIVGIIFTILAGVNYQII